MSIEAVVGLSNQLTVEALLAEARLIRRHEQNRLALHIKGEGYSLFAIRCVEAQLLHIGVAGAVHRVNARPPQLRPELMEKARQCQNLSPHVLVQRVELRFKLVADLNNPVHTYNMA